VNEVYPPDIPCPKIHLFFFLIRIRTFGTFGITKNITLLDLI
jgi:hypothetical protein